MRYYGEVVNNLDHAEGTHLPYNDDRSSATFEVQPGQSSGIYGVSYSGFSNLVTRMGATPTFREGHDGETIAIAVLTWEDGV